MKTHGKALPQFVRDLLASTPPRGTGLNLWLFRVARVMHPYRTKGEIIDTLLAATAGEPLQPGEIERAVERSEATAWQPGAKQSPRIARAPKWPPLNVEQREAILAEGLRLHDLWMASPVRTKNAEPVTEEIIDAFFPGNPWLCVGSNSREFRTRRREGLRGELASLPLIVPSPMTAQTGMTQEGKVSEHTLASTGPRRFLVAEFDNGNSDDQAAILLHLAKRAPLALAVHSGGKSLHGWFYCSGQSEETTRSFMRYAVSLGADPATWPRLQFVRMPDGTRENGFRQTLWFYNPAVIR